MIKKERNNTISIAKGIGIILMVIGHSGCPRLLNDFIYLFHMPLFYFTAGYCFKEKYISLPKEFMKKRIKGLWLPFIKYVGLFILLHNIFYYLHLYDHSINEADHLYSIWETIKKIGNAALLMRSHEALLGGYWFIRSLFIASILFYLCLWIFHKNKYSNWYSFFAFGIIFAGGGFCGITIFTPSLPSG